MRFLVLTQYFPPEVGAAQLRLAATVDELRRQGHEVEVVTALPNYPTGAIYPEYRGRVYAREERDGLVIHRVWLYAATGAGVRRVLNFASFVATSLLGLVRARRPDFIFVESPPLFLSIPALLCARLWGARVIYNVADLWLDQVRALGLLHDGVLLRLAEAVERWTLRASDYVNVVTEGLRTRLIHEKGVPAEKVLFLPNGVDTDLFAPSEPDRELERELGLGGKQVVVYAGTHGYAHGIDVAIAAARLLREENVEFIFIGDGSEKRRLIELARDTAATNVRFLDSAPPTYIARLYSVALTGLSTLRDVPLADATRPVKIFATMASAKPVLYSGGGEGARLVLAADAGIVVPWGSADELAGAVRALIAAPDIAATLGRNGRRYVEENLRWSSLVGDWLSQLTAPAVPTVPGSDAARLAADSAHT